tara:strand:- start:231 stop:1499 length:1269 start_codon:yes stop_codon:yes gene_type:complete
MAKLDLNSRYGTYAAEAALGGYNRKELRGLNRQAKRGTLNQRERARLKYLTEERKGRRKRGLLAGLGGAAATLGGLALAGKLGKGEGGSALMDAIKSRLAAKRVMRPINKEMKQEEQLQKMLRKQAMSGDVPTEADSVVPSRKDDPLLSRIIRRPRNLEDIDQPEEDFDPGQDEDIALSSLFEKLEKTPSESDIYRSLREAEDSGPTQPSELELMGLSGSLPTGSRKVSQDTSRTQEVSKLLKSLDEKSIGESGVPLLDRTSLASGPGPEGRSVENARAIAREMAKRQDEKADEEMDYLNFKGRLSQSPSLQRLLRYGRFDKGGKVSEGDSNVNDLLKRLDNMGRTDEDPLKKAARQSLGDLSDIQKRVLMDFNNMRAEHGLDPVDELTEENVSEMEALKSGMSKGGAIKNSLRNSMNNRYR